MSNVPVLLDIETRSACDLKTAGGYVYAADPSTRLLTVAWTDDFGETYHVWCPGATAAPPESDPDTTWHVGPECPMAHLTDRIWVAHNAWTFDREVWRAQPGLPQPRKWGDTYPLALQQGLPGQLDQIGKRLWGEGKMPEGKSALLKWTRAKDAADADPRNVPPGLTWLIARYNVQDVRLLSHLWKELDEGRKQPATENRVMFAHDAVNDRGVRVDLGLVRALRDLSRESVAHAVREIAELTGGALPDLHSLRQRNRVLDWLERHGVRLTSGGKRTVRREAVDQWLATIEGDAEETDGDPDAGAEFDAQSLLLAARVMRLRNAAMRITEAKLDAALSRVTDAGRLRGLFAYWSAHCVSGDTEVLTRNGWVRIDEWTGGDIVQWRPDGSMEWLHATPNRFETDEPTVELSGPHVTGRFTLGHTIPAYNTVGTFVTKQAGDMGNHPHYHLPLTGVRLVGDGTITAEQMRVLVAVQADGHWVTNTRHGRSLQWTFRKKRKIDRIQTLLAAVGVPYRIQEFPSCPGQVRVSVRWKDCPKWLSPERKVFGPWLFDSTEDARAAFLDELPRWDGHDPGPGGNLTYSSSISANLEWAQTMCHLAGVAAKVSGRCLTIRQTRTATCRAHEWTPAPPLGTVYCPTTVTGFWLYRHHGRIGVTGNTGRWAGRGMQVQNLPRPKKGVPVWDLIRQYEATGRLEYEAVRGMLSDGATTDDAASALIRGIFLPDEGQVLLAADLSSIESRVLAWLAGEESLVKTFTDFGCPYSLMASKLYGRAVTSKKDPIRQVGKVIVLGCGYGLGDQKFAQYGAAQGIDFAEQGVTPFECVDAFRTAFPRIAGHVQGEYEGRKWRRGGFWEDLQTVALEAVRSPGREMGVGRIGFESYAGHLYVTLPSGRYLCYRNAREVETTTWWGKAVSTVEYQSPRFKGVTMYGGKWAENVVQAVSRDFLAGALVRLRSSTVLHVHDEVVASGRPEDLPAFMRAFTTRESWAAGLPLDAEGGIMPRYAKAPPPDWPKEETWRNGERVG